MFIGCSEQVLLWGLFSFLRGTRKTDALGTFCSKPVPPTDARAPHQLPSRTYHSVQSLRPPLALGFGPDLYRRPGILGR